MSLPNFNDIKLLSNAEISKSIIELEKKLFDLRFRKATRQSFKSHQIKQKKCQLVYFKTILTLRLKNKTKQYLIY